MPARSGRRSSYRRPTSNTASTTTATTASTCAIRCRTYSPPPPIYSRPAAGAPASRSARAPPILSRCASGITPRSIARPWCCSPNGSPSNLAGRISRPRPSRSRSRTAARPHGMSPPGARPFDNRGNAASEGNTQRAHPLVLAKSGDPVLWIFCLRGKAGPRYSSPSTMRMSRTAPSECLERLAVFRAVVRGDRLLDAGEFRHHNALLPPRLEGGGRVAAREVSHAVFRQRSRRKLGVGGDLGGVLDFAIAGDPVAFGHGGLP